jgi:hypothetical protein
MNKEELIERGRMIWERTDKDIGHVMDDLELCEYWKMLIDHTFKPIKSVVDSHLDQFDWKEQRRTIPPLAKLFIKLIAVVCFEDLIRVRKEKKIDYADNRNIYSIVMSMLFYECFKGKEGDEWPGLSDTDLIKSSLRVVRSLR